MNKRPKVAITSGIAFAMGILVYNLVLHGDRPFYETIVRAVIGGLVYGAFLLFLLNRSAKKTADKS